MARGEYIEKPKAVGFRAVAYAVLAQGLEDAVKGDPGARSWLGSRAFEYWCDWCDLRPGWVMRMVEPLLPPPGQPRKKRPRAGGKQRGSGRQLTAEELARAVAEHEAGRPWADVAGHYGVSKETLRAALMAAGYHEKRLASRRRKVWTAEELARAQALYQRHGSWDLVAQAMGTAQKTLVRALRDAGHVVEAGDKSRFNPSISRG